VSSSLTDTENVVPTIKHAVNLSLSKDFGKVFICGGSNIYREFLENRFPLHEIHLTKIDKDFDCDNFFPQHLLNLDKYKLFSKDTFRLNNQEPLTITFYKYRRNIDHINEAEEQYLAIMKKIITDGGSYQTRNGNTKAIFNQHLKFDLSKGFPMLTTKKIFSKGIIEELLFFLRGDTNANHLIEHGVKIWSANTSRDFLDKNGLDYQEGDMGPMYGYNWRHFGAEYQGMNHCSTEGFDQIEYCLDLLKNNPFSRRILMTSYDPTNAKKGVLYPCHGISILFNVSHDHKLHCMMTQRSADFFLGVPFNIASYALLVRLFCEVINNDDTYFGPKFTPGELVINMGNVHLYENHFSQAIRQVLREPKLFPELIFKKKIISLTEITSDDIEIKNYECYPGIIAPIVA